MGVGRSVLGVAGDTACGIGAETVKGISADLLHVNLLVAAVDSDSCRVVDDAAVVSAAGWKDCWSSQQC